MKPIVYVRRLGRIPYREALDIQLSLFEDLKSRVSSISSTAKSAEQLSAIQRPDIPKLSTPDIPKTFRQHIFANREPRNWILLLEHDPVYTIGLRSQPYDQVYVSKLRKSLDDHNVQADFVETNRGGLITFHGPGQLIAYPIIYLGDFKKSVPNKSVREYVKNLENTIISTLGMVGLNNAHTVSEYPGVWLGGGDRKIAFVGISCKRHVTMHGISINCNCDLSWFDHIVSCGIENKAITSIQRELSTDELSKVKSTKVGCPKHGIQHVANAFCSSFKKCFECELFEE